MVFAVTAGAYKHILDSNDAWKKLHVQLDDLDPNNVTQLQEKGKACREIIYDCTLPADLMSAEIQNAYETDQKGIWTRGNACSQKFCHCRRLP